MDLRLNAHVSQFTHNSNFFILKSWMCDVISATVINSLAPGKLELNFRHVIFKKILVIDGWDISCEIALIWM